MLVSAGGPLSVDAFWARFGLALPFILFNAFLSLGVLCRLLQRPSARRALRLTLIVMAVCTGLVLISSAAVVWIAPFETATSQSWFILRNTLMALLLSFLLARFLVLQNQWRMQVALESRVRLEALQARIHPHFLFNALNAVSELIHRQPDQAEDALIDLSDLLRTGLRGDTRHRLAEEIELIRAYLRIESLRLGDRLVVEWEIDPKVDQGMQLPALLIQPLVENAVLHGIAPSPEGGVLQLRIQAMRFGRVRVVVENPLPSENARPHAGNRTALENIRQRLALAYEEGASLKVESKDQRFRAQLVLPSAARS